ncbi:uncharacterized protein isoform X2 [Musca autumnalis]|uniref:uncharacterized protein isoform X2 n=1 Tax=Musca autumnalis TaxID=221902 RepID=UPI003CF511BE
MSSTNFNDFASNCDVMIHIYKFLNVGDQLRLAQVNGKLRNLFLQYIWSISYNKLTIIEYEYLLYAASNCMDKDRILYLNSSDLEEFLTFYGNNVNGLYTNTRLRMEFFRNLIELKYCNKGVILNEMTQLSNTSPNLEVLQVYDHGLEFLPPNYFITRELPLLQELAVRELASLICPTLQAVVTSINCIKIFCFKPPGPTIGFWFDMFSLNPQLELQMRIAELDRETLQNLIQNEKFPSNLRKIKFFGLPVDCSELRNNCESVWKRLHYLIYDYEDHYTNGRKCNIIMSRNYNK